MKYNEKTAAAVLNSLLRAARKQPREGLHDAWTDEQGRTCALDGFRAYCLNTAPAGMQVTWTCRPDPARAAARAAENNAILARVFAALDAGKVVEMPAPDADAVKAFIAAEKQEPTHKGIYDLGKDFPAVNMKYLYDIIRLFPAAKWYVSADPYARMVSPIFIVADEGRACLLPVRVDSKPWKAPEAPAAPVEKPAPAPVKKPAAKRPETISNDPRTAPASFRSCSWCWPPFVCYGVPRLSMPYYHGVPRLSSPFAKFFRGKFSGCGRQILPGCKAAPSCLYPGKCWRAGSS